MPPSSIPTSLRPSVRPGWLSLVWWFLGANLMLAGVCAIMAPDGFNETVLEHTRDVLRVRNVYDDSWGAMGQALDYLNSVHTTPVYTAVFFEAGRKFQYPVSALIPFELLRAHVDFVGVCFLIVMMLALAALLRDRMRRLPVTPSRWDTMSGVALVVVCTLTFYPVVKAFTLGQIQVWINASFALAVLAWSTGRRAGAGVLVGLMALIKPQYALFLIWGILRREGRFATSVVTTGLVGLLVAGARFGWENHLDYVKVLSHLSRHGESFHPNQSVNGLLNRLAGLTRPELFDNLKSELSFPPFTPWVYAGTLISSVALLVLALRGDVRRGAGDRTIDFCLMAVSCTIASPIAWEHHYGILLPVFVVLLAEHTQRGWNMLALAVGYVLTSHYWQVTNLLASSRMNVLQSYLFFGALLMLALLYRARAASET